MKTSYLKIASLASALLVFFPTRSRIMLPFAFSLSGYENYSGLQALIIPTAVWIGLIYLLYSAIKDLQSKTDSIISLIPLFAFLLLLATHVMDFIDYANWLSLTTGIISTIIIAITILQLSKRLRLPHKKSLF